MTAKQTAWGSQFTKISYIDVKLEIGNIQG